MILQGDWKTGTYAKMGQDSYSSKQAEILTVLICNLAL